MRSCPGQSLLGPRWRYWLAVENSDQAGVAGGSRRRVQDDARRSMPWKSGFVVDRRSLMLHRNPQRPHINQTARPTISRRRTAVERQARHCWTSGAGGRAVSDICPLTDPSEPTVPAPASEVGCLRRLPALGPPANRPLRCVWRQPYAETARRESGPRREGEVPERALAVVGPGPPARAGTPCNQWRRFYDPVPRWLLPGCPGPVPWPSLVGGLPGGCASTPLPTPLFPFCSAGLPPPGGSTPLPTPLLTSCCSGLPDPYDAKAESAFRVRTSGATYATFLTKDLRDSLSLTLLGSPIETPLPRDKVQTARESDHHPQQPPLRWSLVPSL